MTLRKAYMKRMLKFMFKRKNLLDMVFMWAVLIVVSLLSKYLPYTSITEKSLVKLVEDYFHMPLSETSLDIAFLIMELPLLIGVLATTTTTTIPLKTILYEKVSGNIEIILSYCRNINEFIKAIFLSTITVSLLAYFLYSLVGLATILGYKLIYGVEFQLPSTFYAIMFILNPIIILLSSSLAVLVPVIKPSIASIEFSSLSSNNPAILLASSPPIILFVIATLFPLYIPKMAIYIPPATALILGMTLLIAKRTLRRDLLVKRS
ncbi:hypothetical protein PNA2_1524 [Pyrococcus sp. NA2]|uniref:hypothetical protein n=1 Tax=Pyrococcus sp. (strain NA2) TaxID=342949 RepID=UPI000209B074|nr:hypothetical protein [Pyrococcus sp. NA2]AEC52439.1 hypothetical protein PNA2_1524 [Pyrococcus sp. NA2]